MSLEALRDANKAIGVKQVTKAVNKNLVQLVFFAEDADARVLRPLRDLCSEKEIRAVDVATMSELGTACRIEVGAAAAAILKP